MKKEEEEEKEKEILYTPEQSSEEDDELSEGWLEESAPMDEGAPLQVPELGEIPEEFLEGIRDMEAYGDYQYVAGSNMEITYKAYDTKLDCDVIVKRVRFPTKKQQILHCAKLDLNIKVQ